MTLIPKFNAYSFRADQLTQKTEVDLEQIKNDQILEAQNDNANQDFMNHQVPIDSGSIYTDRLNILILEQTKEQVFENYFQIREIKYSWNINGTWNGIDRDFVAGWNGIHNYSNQNSVSYKVGSYDGVPPNERCCDLPFYEFTNHTTSNNWRTNEGFLWSASKRYIYSAENYGSRGFGNNLSFGMILFVGNYPTYNATLNFGNGAFRYLTTSPNINPFITQIPLIVKDRGNVYNGFVCGNSTMGSWTDSVTFNGSFEIEIFRHQFEQ